MGNVLYWKMSFPLLDIKSLEHRQALIGSLTWKSYFQLGSKTVYSLP